MTLSMVGERVAYIFVDTWEHWPPIPDRQQMWASHERWTRNGPEHGILSKERVLPTCTP